MLVLGKSKTVFSLHVSVRVAVVPLQVGTLHFTLHTLHTTLYTPQCPLHILHFTLHTPHSTFYTPHSTLDTPHLTLYTPHLTLDIPHFTQDIFYVIYFGDPLCAVHSGSLVSLVFFSLSCIPCRQASRSRLAITNTKRHAMDGRTYHRKSNQIPIRDPMGPTIPVASGFLITKKRSLDQNRPKCFGVPKFQVQRKGRQSRQAKACAMLGSVVVIFKCWESWS